MSGFIGDTICSRLLITVLPRFGRRPASPLRFVRTRRDDRRVARD
jgi:hypothetical protein